MTLLTTAFAQGTHAARPAATAANEGYYYYETDTETLFQSTGAAWTQIAASAAGGGGTTSPLTTKGDLWGFDTDDDRIPVGADGKALLADSGQALGLKWDYPPGHEFGYDQITASVPITCGAHTFDGAAVIAEFFCPVINTPATNGGNIIIGLFESGTLINRLGFMQSQAVSNAGVSIAGGFRFTPSAASHSYVVKAWATSTSGTPELYCGPGGSGNNSPCWVRFTKV